MDLLADLEGMGVEIIIEMGNSRAKNMNNGALKASKEYLWFLHADSRVTKENITSLTKALNDKPNALHYFSLKFAQDGPAWMKVNMWGANFRSKIFGLPFGDQGFCIKKSLFNQLGTYREDLSYAEDLMFVWQARQSRIVLNNISSYLLTSARKYQEKGWFKLTWLYQLIWIKMSIPEFFKLIKFRVLS